jgi:hypothetical protein
VIIDIRLRGSGMVSFDFLISGSRLRGVTDSDRRGQGNEDRENIKELSWEERREGMLIEWRERRKQS